MFRIKNEVEAKHLNPGSAACRFSPLRPWPFGQRGAAHVGETGQIRKFSKKSVGSTAMSRNSGPTGVVVHMKTSLSNRMRAAWSLGLTENSWSIRSPLCTSAFSLFVVCIPRLVPGIWSKQVAPKLPSETGGDEQHGGEAQETYVRPSTTTKLEVRPVAVHSLSFSRRFKPFLRFSFCPPS